MADPKFIIEEFKKYKVSLFSGGGANALGATVSIKLKNNSKALFSFKSGRLRKNKVNSKGNSKIYEIFVPYERYSAFIDILRNEKPLFFYYNLSDNVSYITTSDEPVGEGED